MPSWATFNPTYTSGSTTINTSFLADSDVGSGEFDFKYTKYSIDVPSNILSTQTIKVIIGKYNLSTVSPIIPDPVYIEDSETTLTLPTILRDPTSMPAVSYQIKGLIAGMYIAPTVPANEPVTFNLTIKPCAMKTVGAHTLSV